MILEGYKYNQYDATYRKAVFNVIDRGNESRVLEITDVESGQTFIVDFGNRDQEYKNRVRTWRKPREKQQGKAIHFGKKGMFEQLKYNERKQH